jgi:hypothetical protein
LTLNLVHSRLARVVGWLANPDGFPGHEVTPFRGTNVPSEFVKSSMGKYDVKLESETVLKEHK